MAPISSMLAIFVVFSSLFFSIVQCGVEEHFDDVKLMRNENGSEPQQVHLSFGRSPLEIVVTWTTYNVSDIALLRFGPVKEESWTLLGGETTPFYDPGSLRRVHYIHRVLIENLDPFTLYRYQCGNDEKWSKLFEFHTSSADSDLSPEILVYGDLGLFNGQSIPRLAGEVYNGTIDAIIHVGDIAYNMDTQNSRVGDEFMRRIEAVAAHVPYQMCPGNHESEYYGTNAAANTNFSNYNARFSMVNMFGRDTGKMNNFFHAFHLGPALFIGFSTEFYFYTSYGEDLPRIQYDWLEATLQEANLPENRAEHPWIITFGHRPMYCSNNDTDDCTKFESITRRGIGKEHKWGLEDLFFKYGVDLEFFAHEHSYERLLPVYNGTVHRGVDSPYIDPPAPVHIVTGSAGCQEDIDFFRPDLQEWSAKRISDYGYTRLNVLNGTHLRIRQISDDQNGTVVDEIMLVQHHHGMRTQLLPSQWPYPL